MYGYRLLSSRPEDASIADYCDDSDVLEKVKRKSQFMAILLIVLCSLLILTGIILIYQAFALYIKSAAFWKGLYDAVADRLLTVPRKSHRH